MQWSSTIPLERMIACSNHSGLIAIIFFSSQISCPLLKGDFTTRGCMQLFLKFGGGGMAISTQPIYGTDNHNTGLQEKRLTDKSLKMAENYCHSIDPEIVSTYYYSFCANRRVEITSSS
jgi:hypothetical protein